MKLVSSSNRVTFIIVGVINNVSNRNYYYRNHSKQRCEFRPPWKMLHMEAFSSGLEQSTNDNSELRYEDAFQWTVLVMAPGLKRSFEFAIKSDRQRSHCYSFLEPRSV